MNFIVNKERSRQN